MEESYSSDPHFRLISKSEDVDSVRQDARNRYTLALRRAVSDESSNERHQCEMMLGDWWPGTEEQYPELDDTWECRTNFDEFVKIY